MKIICFVGNQSSGKSTTIKYILERFFKIKVSYPKRWKDFNLTLFYEGKKIGLWNKGDMPETLEEGLKDLKNEGCDIIICSRHKAESFLNVIKNVFPNADIKEIECNKPKLNDEEHWALEHKKRIEMFKELEFMKDQDVSDATEMAYEFKDKKAP